MRFACLKTVPASLQGRPTDTLGDYLETVLDRYLDTSFEASENRYTHPKKCGNTETGPEQSAALNLEVQVSQ